MDEQIIYVGSGRTKRFNNGGSLISVSFTIDGLKDYFEKYGFTTKAGKKIIKLNLIPRRQPDQYGNDYSLSIDTFKPSQRTNTQSGGNVPYQGQQPQNRNHQPSGGNYNGGGGSPMPFQDDIPFAPSYF